MTRIDAPPPHRPLSSRAAPTAASALHLLRREAVEAAKVNYVRRRELVVGGWSEGSAPGGRTYAYGDVTWAEEIAVCFTP